MIGKAYVRSAQILSPRQEGEAFVLRIEGDLADGCTQIDHIVQERTAYGLSVTVLTARPLGALCTQALVPFVRDVQLDTSGMTDGDYLVNVHGVQAALTLSPPEEDEPSRLPMAADALERAAALDSMDVMTLESYPVQVRVLIRGYYPDGCTCLGKVRQSVEGERILLQVFTTRPRDAMCTQALVPFEESIPVDVRDLTPGSYVLEVNGLTQPLDIP